MIGSFWNLCRACPSMPVDKLHSEYRSTYRWHEYRGGSGAQQATQGGPQGESATVAPQNAAAPPPQPAVVRRAPLPSQTNPQRAPSIEPAMPRRKKYPGLAYKTNEIFDAPAAGLPSGTNSTGIDFGASQTLDRARSMERTKYMVSRGERRSKSEGPRTAKTGAPRNWTDTVEEKNTSLAIAEKKFNTEYRNQFAWPKEDANLAGAGAENHPRKSVSMGALKAAQQNAKKRPGEAGGATELEPLMNHVDDDDKKYIEDYAKDGDAPAVHRKITFRSAIAPFITRDDTKSKVEPRKGYKSEYKKKFRPFSHYVYEASKGTFTKCRELKASAKARGAKAPPPEDPAAEKMLPKDTTDDAGGARPQLPNGTLPQSLGEKAADSWYREVLDLRKRAGEYKCRGWGTELASENITEIYHKQMELWDQVSRRSSLSALSLAAVNHRMITKEEKENENKNKTSPKKPRSFRSAPHQSIHAKLQETRTQETAAQKNQRKKLQGHSFDNTTISEGKTGAQNRTSARTSPRKQLNLVIGARGSSVEPTMDHGPRSLEYRSPKRRPRSADPKPHQPMSNGPLEDKRRPSKPSDEDVVPIRSGSAFRDYRLLDDSPVVKSPPEPTRVKSPEQMNMRSPDPVNWTVPLDTGKTFTVTQNVKSDDMIKRPGSDFKNTWGIDDQHSTSISAPLETDDGTLATPKSIQQELASIHQSSKSDITPPKSVEISQRPVVTNLKQAKTPTSPPNLTPIDETKVLDMSKPVVNGGGSSSSDTHPSPITGESRLPVDDPSFEMATIMSQPGETFKPTEATQKSHGGVDTSIVSPTSQPSVAAEVLERARTRFDQFWGKKDSGNDNV